MHTAKSSGSITDEYRFRANYICYDPQTISNKYRIFNGEYVMVAVVGLQ